MSAERAARCSRSTRPGQALPDQVRASSSTARSGAVRAVDDVSFTVARGRDARAWSASPAAASRPSRRSILQLLRADLGLGAVPGPELDRARPARAAAAAARDADDLPGPVRVAEPAQADRRRSSATRCSCTGSPRAPSSSERVQRAARAASGSQPEHSTASRTSSPAASASGSASPGRWRWSRSSIDRRRAGLGARRLDPGPDHQPARGPPGRVRAHLPVRRPRPRRRPPRLRPDRGHVPGQDRRDRPRRGALRQPDPPLHGLAALGGPDPRPAAERARASRSCSRATCRARPTRRAAAASTPAARTRPRSAPRSSRELVDYGGGHFAACHHPVGRNARGVAAAPAATA